MRDIGQIFSAFIKGKWFYVIIYALANLLQALFSLISLAMLIPFLDLLFGDKKELLRVNPGFEFNADGIQNYLNYEMKSCEILCAFGK